MINKYLEERQKTIKNLKRLQQTKEPIDKYFQK